MSPNSSASLSSSPKHSSEALAAPLPLQKQGVKRTSIKAQGSRERQRETVFLQPTDRRHPEEVLVKEEEVLVKEEEVLVKEEEVPERHDLVIRRSWYTVMVWVALNNKSRWTGNQVGPQCHYSTCLLLRLLTQGCTLCPYEQCPR
ncbi:hypothetical protein DPEC_G00224850 [Dallia pectoralis]|uniref:Uncharacterized protein n=1 Tax=Dallia pectoralis TaxID=75939 RepID=A0ACC2G0G6_DALPE|nr:hypothetical protein DPEC_G00224850 [Dallia pectoralis]